MNSNYDSIINFYGVYSNKERYTCTMDCCFKVRKHVLSRLYIRDTVYSVDSLFITNSGFSFNYVQNGSIN